MDLTFNNHFHLKLKIDQIIYEIFLSDLFERKSFLFWIGNN